MVVIGGRGQDSLANTTSAQAEKVFTVLFTLEFLVSVVTHGFVLHAGSYLRSGWNVLDFVIVLLSWLSFFRAPPRHSPSLPPSSYLPGLRNWAVASTASRRCLG